MTKMQLGLLCSAEQEQGLSTRGHAFRGALIDNCAAIETWLTTILTEAAARERPGKAHYLGQKLEAARELAQADQALPGNQRLLKRPNRVIELLDQIGPYADLRSSLAHAVQSIALSRDGEPVFLFAPVEKQDKGMQIALTLAAQSFILANVRRLVKELAEQQLRPANPSVPPRPSPASAAGP
jgi:hypothetical protein